MDDEGGGPTGVGIWKQNLYLLQERAPKPNPVRCTNRIENRPHQYGDEFHGLIDREESDKLLTEAGEGSYLVRASKRSEGSYTLCLFFNGRILNYMLYYDGMHYVGKKRFDTMDLLVADGLISMYMDLHAAEYITRMADEAIYEDSPYSRYTQSTDTARKPETRAHSFSSYTFRTPHYCDYCRNFLWGLVHQGMRCEDCGFAAHSGCAVKAMNDCRPEAKYVKRMFAVDITTFCIAHQTEVPPVVRHCIDEVELRGLNVEGIYRVSGSHEHIERLRAQYDAQQSVDLSQVLDIHTVCGVFKLYFRLLPQQLIPFSIYKELLAAFSSSTGRSTHDRARILRRVLRELSPANFTTLGVLLKHLKTVSEHKAKNKMTIENLATIFSPTLFCTGAVPALPVQQHQLLHFLILHPENINQLK